MNKDAEGRWKVDTSESNWKSWSIVAWAFSGYPRFISYRWRKSSLPPKGFIPSRWIWFVDPNADGRRLGRNVS